MEQLAAWYASSSEEEEDAARTRDHSTAEPPQTSQRSHHATVARDASDAPSPRRAAAARVALAQRFAIRARAATHRVTTDERSFAYRPYPARKAGQSAHTVQKAGGQTPSAKPKTRAHSPLFSTLKALSTPVDAFHTAPFDVHTARAGPVDDVPSWQKHRRMEGHTGAVMSLHWNPLYPPLFLSPSMDGTLRVWSLPHAYYDDDPSARPVDDSPRCRRVLTHHTRGVKSAKWSIDGHHLWSGGYDGQAAYVDVETANVVQRYIHHTNEHVTCVTPHPLDPQLALIGTDRGRVLQRDLRLAASSSPCTVYGTKTTGEIHDLLFLPSEQGHDTLFISSSALTARDTSHQTLLVWDVQSGALLADHLNNDLCSFTSLQLHPNRKQFAGQSTTSEIVLFSANAPYKRLKPKRSFHGGHDAQGFSVGFGFNASGELLATGDVYGRVVLYDTRRRRALKQYQPYDASTPCLAVAFHPQWQSTLLSGSNDGGIELFDSLISVPS